MKKKILLIDDDGLVLKTLTNLLESNGYEVVGCKSGSDALAHFREGAFDLVISDIRMPSKDGILVLKEIRKQEGETGQPLTPFIIITGYASEDVPLEAIKLGVQGYVLKPFDRERFLFTIKEALGKRRKAPEGKPTPDQILSQIKTLVSNFHNENEKQIFSNQSLKDFFHTLETHLSEIEKELVRSS